MKNLRFNSGYLIRRSCVFGSVIPFTWIDFGLGRIFQVVVFLMFIFFLKTKLNTRSIFHFSVVILFFTIVSIPNATNDTFKQLLILICVLPIATALYSQITLTEFYKDIFYTLQIFILISIGVVFIKVPTAFDNIYGDDLSTNFLQINGIFDSANYFYLIVNAYLVSLTGAWTSISNRSRAFSLVLIVLLAFVIFQYPLTSRVFIITIIFCTLVRFVSIKFTIFITFVAGILTFTFIDVVMQSSDSEYFKIHDLLRYGMFGNRTILWEASISAIVNKELFMFGYGLGNDHMAFKNIDLVGFEGLHPHSVIFSGILEFGLISFSLLSCIIAYVLYQKYIKIQNHKQKYQYIAFVSMILISGIFDTVFLKATNPLFAIFIFFLSSKVQKHGN